MKSRLQQAGLWSDDSNEDEINISFAWHLLSHLGLPVRYGGRSQDGLYEYVVIDPETGRFLATGRGPTLELSMCDAALNTTPLKINAEARH